MTEYNRLPSPIILGLLGILCLVLAWKQDRWVDWVRIFLLAAGCFMLLIAFFSAVDILTASMDAHQKRAAIIAVTTPENENLTRLKELVNAVNKLTPDQLEYIRRGYASILSGNGGGIPELKTFGGAVPFWFVDMFLELSSGESMVPIRNWTSGSREQKYAAWLTDHIVKVLHLARPANGNQPATWLYENARRDAYYEIYGDRINSLGAIAQERSQYVSS